MSECGNRHMSVVPTGGSQDPQELVLKGYKPSDIGAEKLRSGSL